jgi:hypothetical protein
MKIKLSDGSSVTFPIEDIKKITFSDVTDIEDFKKVEKAIKTFSLLQNFPNPFNPTTTIEYNIPQKGDVNISIYSINGQKVKEFVYQSQQAGTHKLIWDGKNESGNTVASGFYIYSAKFGKEVIAKKMIFIK